MGVQRWIGSTLVLATAMIASLGTAHAQSASDILARGIGRKPGCGSPAYYVSIINMSTEFYYDVKVAAEFFKLGPVPGQCAGNSCTGKIDDVRHILPLCGSPGYCAAVDGGNSTGFPTCCNLPAEKCNDPDAYCVTTDWLEVTIEAFSSDGMTWTPIDPQVVCKFPFQEGYPMCQVGNECQIHPPLPCQHPPCVVS